MKRSIWVILLFAAGCVGADPGSSGTSHTIDPSDVVVSPGTAPEGLARDDVGGGLQTLSYPLLSDRSRALVGTDAEPHFIDGGYATFSGAAGALLSLAMEFASVEAAEAMVEILAGELESADGYGLPPGTPLPLGDGGLRYEGDVAALDGLHEIIFVWRRGRIVLVAGGPLAPEQIKEVAEAMNERAG